MTNEKIIIILEKELDEVMTIQARLMRKPRTAQIEAFLKSLEEQINNIILSIEDFKGIISNG